MKDRSWMGNPNQQLQVSRARLAGGREDGLEMIQVETGAGFSFSVAPGQAMSLKTARFCGMNLTYIPPGGFTGPALMGQSNYFEGGLMFTCGLESTGPVNGPYRQHGSLRYQPAGDVSVKRVETDGDRGVEIKGTIIQSGLSLPPLTLERTIRCMNSVPKLWIHDEITNRSAERAGWMIMYHFNFGWPLLSPKAKIEIPSVAIRPKNQVAEAALDRYLQIEEPQEDWTPQVFCHSLDMEKDMADIALINPSEGVGVTIRTDTG